MKKFIFGLIMAMLCLIGAGTFTSCNDVKEKLSTACVDSAKVTEIVDQYHNPKFTSTISFMSYVSEEVQYQDFIDIIHHMHPKTVETVASSCIDNYGSVDAYLFLQEFRDHESTYTNVDKVNWKADRTNVSMQIEALGKCRIDSVTEPNTEDLQ